MPWLFSVECNSSMLDFDVWKKCFSLVAEDLLVERLRAGEDISTVKAMGAACSDLDLCSVLDVWLIAVVQ